jgi:CRISPR-associated protein Cas1
VRVPIDESTRQDVHTAVDRSRVLAAATIRPPVTSNERLCGRCSLAPVCLPEETRKAETATHTATRLFPANDERRPFHVEGYGCRVGRAGDELSVTPLEGAATKEPIHDVRSVTIHGHVGISAQALQLCSQNDVAVHWLSSGGRYVGSFFCDDAAVQRRIRQYDALRGDAMRMHLARALVAARAQGQLRFILRATQGRDREELGIARAIDGIRNMLPAIERAVDPGVLLGMEGQAASCYFEALPALIDHGIDERLRPRDRNRRPPLDPFNALLSFGYGLLLREVTQAIRSVGLDGAFGFYHRPRSSAPPLALDVMELFRVAAVDMPVVAAINRKQFDPDADFTRAGRQIWLSDSGRRKFIDVFERRLADVWRHPVLEYSLSYRRHIELEVRLLEKEWSGEPGLFACTRLR